MQYLTSGWIVKRSGSQGIDSRRPARARAASAIPAQRRFKDLMANSPVPTMRAHAQNEDMARGIWDSGLVSSLNSRLKPAKVSWRA
jgi:hypothetical protein